MEFQRSAGADVIAKSERLERLLSNLLPLTDITAGRLRASLEPVLLEPLATLLEEVLRNLYENAVKYSPQGGTVRTTHL